MLVWNDDLCPQSTPERFHQSESMRTPHLRVPVEVLSQSANDTQKESAKSDPNQVFFTDRLSPPLGNYKEDKSRESVRV